MYVQLQFGALRAARFLDLSRLAAPRRIRVRDEVLAIGAPRTYTDLTRSRLVRRWLPMLAAAAAAAAAPIAEAQRVLGEEIQPIDDVRSTADYGRQVAVNLLERFWTDTGG